MKSVALMTLLVLVISCRTTSNTSSLQEAARASSYIEIDGVAGSSDEQIFAQFMSQELKDARIVGLGEIVHGSGGLHVAMGEVGKSLINNDGYRFIAIESPWVGVESLDQYFAACAKGDVIDPTSLQVFPQFTTAELNQFYKWVCTFNKLHPTDRVHAYGFDVQQLGIIPSDLQDEPQLLMQVSRIRDFVRLPQEFNIHNCGQYSVDLTKYNVCKKSLEVLLGESSKAKQEIISIHGKDFYFKLITRVTSLTHWVEYRYQQSIQNHYLSGTARDSGMAQLFQLADEYYGSGKTLVIAHLGHIARNAEYDGNRFNPNYDNMGSVLHVKFKSSFKLIGFSAKQLECAATLCPEPPFEVPAEYHEYWSEKILSESFENNAVLVLERSTHLVPTKPYFVGGGFGVLKDNFDLLFYLRESKAAAQ